MYLFILLAATINECTKVDQLPRLIHQTLHTNFNPVAPDLLILLLMECKDLEDLSLHTVSSILKSIEQY